MSFVNNLHSSPNHIKRPRKVFSVTTLQGLYLLLLSSSYLQAIRSYFTLIFFTLENELLYVLPFTFL